MKTVRPRVATLRTGLASVVSSNSWIPTGANAHDRGYNYAWKKARERYLKAHPLCVRCEAAGHIEPATVVDHRIPHRGDQRLFWDENNWQSMCAPHHSGDKQREEAEALRAIQS